MLAIIGAAFFLCGFCFLVALSYFPGYFVWYVSWIVPVSLFLGMWCLSKVYDNEP